jgi:hypothetical protein
VEKKLQIVLFRGKCTGTIILLSHIDAIINFYIYSIDIKTKYFPTVSFYGFGGCIGGSFFKLKKNQLGFWEILLQNLWIISCF